MPKYYAGIGSRQTPADVLTTMTRWARNLYGDGWILRSGRAVGADRAFESGVPIQLPIRPFVVQGKEIFTPKDGDISPAAYDLAATIHPAWHLCSEYAKACHARNCYQVLGRDLETPVAFVLCWTPCGSECEASTNRDTGGTRTAIVLASRRSIPVFNLRNCDASSRLLTFLTETTY